MVGDLISREKLLEEFRWLKSQVGEARAAEYDEIMERIENAPAVCEDVYSDWYERLSNLDYNYHPEPNGEPWYQAKDVWACIEEEPKDV